MTSHSRSRLSHNAAPLFFLLLCEVCLCQVVSVDHVNIGFSASAIQWVDTSGVFLHSVNHTFGLGFSSIGGNSGSASYYLRICHLSTSKNVWYANRNSPIRQSDLLSFKNDGSLTLQNTRGKVVWTSNTVGGSKLQLLEAGNLVILDKNNSTLWQSFDHPTDTLLTGQKFGPNMKLVGSQSEEDVSDGPYYLSMVESTLALYANTSSQVFWKMASDGKATKLNHEGVPAAYAQIYSDALVLFGSDGVMVSEILLDSYQQSTIRRATLEPDGNLRVYFLSGSDWFPAFEAVRDDDHCSLPSTCGEYGLCSNNGQCDCPKLYVPTNITDPSQGCSPVHSSSCTANSSLSLSPYVYELIYVGNINFYANQFTQPQSSLELDTCKQYCMGNCSCTALFFYNESGSCFLWQRLGTMKYDSNINHLAFLKVAQDSSTFSPGHSTSGDSSLAVIFIACGTVAIVIGLCLGAWWLHKRRRALQAPQHTEEDELMDSIPGLPTRFSYKELEVATNAFSHKLGAGGFGSVYEGILPDHTRIAVKRLESIGQGKKEFWAEVATIGSIHHVHLVQLRGFCAEGSHRLLVYELMANGSLAKILFSMGKDGFVLDWDRRCSICLGTARGLAYLHEDCRERIIHCDIKPENILLDENFVAKVSDFGLAKLMNREQSEVFTTLRGTRGYLAPEWLMNYAISEKSDVYSFGMVLLELISGRKNFDPTELSEKWYFPIYAYRQAEAGNVHVLVDPKLNGLADEDQAHKLTRIALWCIQDEVAIRPSMKKVVKMIEGIIDVPKPPSSPQLAVRLHGRKYGSSGNDSGISDFDSAELSASHLSGPR